MRRQRRLLWPFLTRRQSIFFGLRSDDDLVKAAR